MAGKAEEQDRPLPASDPEVIRTLNWCEISLRVWQTWELALQSEGPCTGRHTLWHFNTTPELNECVRLFERPHHGPRLWACLGPADMDRHWERRNTSLKWSTSLKESPNQPQKLLKMWPILEKSPFMCDWFKLLCARQQIRKGEYTLIYSYNNFLVDSSR